MIKLIAKKLIKEGYREQVIELYEELVRSSRQEAGCIKYELYQDEQDTSILAVMEEWENKEALEAHQRTKHFIKLVPMIGELTETLDMNLYTKVF